jgi:NADH-quinone oxidoreductase subunit E
MAVTERRIAMVDAQMIKRSGILEALHKAQADNPAGNFLTEAQLKDIAVEYEVAFAELSGIASFYHFYSTKPRGKYVIRVCDSLPCRVNRAIDIIQFLRDKLGINAGQTRGVFTLEVVNCIGNCDHSPTLTINDDLYSDVTEEKLDEVINTIIETEGGHSCLSGS